MNTQFSASLKQLTYIVIGPTLFLKTFFFNLSKKKSGKWFKTNNYFFKKINQFFLIVLYLIMLQQYKVNENKLMRIKICSKEIFDFKPKQWQ